MPTSAEDLLRRLRAANLEIERANVNNPLPVNPTSVPPSEIHNDVWSTVSPNMTFEEWRNLTTRSIERPTISQRARPVGEGITFSSAEIAMRSFASAGHTHSFTTNISNSFSENNDEDDEDEDFFDEDDEDGESRTSSSPRYNRRTQHLENEDEMSTIGEYFGRNMDPSNVVKHSLVEGTSRVGVEIEVEGFEAVPPRMRYWVAKHDGSLRDNGMEFVFSNPLGGADIKAAIDEIDTILFNNRVSLNLRCSTHVHLDVRDMTVPQLKRLILSYTFFETFLFRQSGEYRLKSNFCTPLSFAEGLAVVLADVWNTDDTHYFLSIITDRWDKYCGINLLPMRNFGSVEFRMSEAKARKGQLLRLINRFLVLKNISIESELNGSEFIEYLTTLDVREVFRKGLTKVSDIRQDDFEIGYYMSKDIVNRELIKAEKQ